MRALKCIPISLICSISLLTTTHGRDWSEIVKLPEKALAVLQFREWQLPQAGNDTKVMARVVRMHAGAVTFQIQGRASRTVPLALLTEEDQKQALEWRKWCPRTLHFKEIKEIVDNQGRSFTARLVATVGPDYAIYKQTGGAVVGNGYHCLKLTQLEPYERLRIYRSIFRGEFEPMVVAGDDGKKFRDMGFKAYRWKPIRGGACPDMVTQLFVPEINRSRGKFPLVVFLHGLGESGDDNTSQFKHDGILSLLSEKNQRRFPCFMLFPQHPDKQPWYGFGPAKPRDSMIAVTHMVRMLIQDYPQLDPSRIYVTGLSSGGRGSLEFITCWPDVYAAAVCMSATLKPFYFSESNARPFWAIWNSGDLPGAKKTLDEVGDLYKKWKVPMKTTMYDRAGHDAWSDGYAEEGFIKWMFSQSLMDRY